MGLVRSVDSDLTAGARYNHGSGDDAIAVLFDVGERRLGVSLGLEYVIICSLLKLNKKEGLKPLCKFYKNGQCKRAKECRFDHPAIC